VRDGFTKRIQSDCAWRQHYYCRSSLLQYMKPVNWHNISRAHSSFIFYEMRIVAGKIVLIRVDICSRCTYPKQSGSKTLVRTVIFII